MALPTIHGHQVGHQFSGHRQRGTIGIALLLFPVIEQRQGAISFLFFFLLYGAEKQKARLSLGWLRLVLAL